MSIDKAIEALTAHWADLMMTLGESDGHDLRELVRQAQPPLEPEPSTSQAVRMARHRLMTFLVQRLPVDHPVRRAIADQSTLGGAAVDERVNSLLQELESMLSQRATAEADVGFRVLARLLAEPAYRQEDLSSEHRHRWLIRLPAADGGFQLPAFQFAADRAPIPIVLEVNRVLGADRDPIGAAFWWLNTSGWLSRSPVDLLGQGRDDDLMSVAALVQEGV